ncbi:hypothetical protein FVEG_17246 [Fusarium verticillioides 7600]|uniref:Uncharacterized protein n=1 Tax=Gibberella moniliformis (strain M3125 / FGSC 7600) TaxID=334819 RepID=W7MSN7_GIBM7|nr:hypothetical protein FVEG_17246 [Fusarium verticillioides 7600]EWG54116.1 hypothetical protein FVEG_17246 [Fusarium verticillioides 7600]
MNSLNALTITEEKLDDDSKEKDRDWNKDKAAENKNEEDEKEQKEPDDWDVLGTVDAYNYPAFCATIPSFPQLEELNGKKRLQGLTLILSMTLTSKISATIDPYLHSFGTSIAIKPLTEPELNIHATYTLTFKGLDPISVKEVIVGSFQKKLLIFHLNPEGKSQLFYESHVSGNERHEKRYHDNSEYRNLTRHGRCNLRRRAYLFHQGIPQETLRYNVFDVEDGRATPTSTPATPP